MGCVRVWPSSGDALSLSALVTPGAAHVLLLPAAGAECVTSDETAMNAETRARMIVANYAAPAAVVRWGATRAAKSVAVLVHATAEGAPVSAAARDVFERACVTPNFDLPPRDCIFTVDELRALLWCVASRPKPDDEVGTSRISLMRGFERLQAFSLQNSGFQNLLSDDDDANIDAVSTSSNLSMNNEKDLDEDEDDENHGYMSASNKLMTPCLSLPSFPAFPVSPPARSPTASPFLKRQQSLRPLNLGQLCMGEPEISTTHEEFRVATKVLSKIRDYLYVGGVASASLDANTLRKHKIVTVVNLAAGAIANDTSARGVKTIRIYARDSEAEDATALIPVVALAVADARRRNAAVLIHCHRGVSRSCAMATAVLMVEERPDAMWALSEVRTARPVASPNPAFVRALQTLQLALLGEPPQRIAALARLQGDPGDGAEVLVDYEKSCEPAIERAWAALVVERNNNAGVLVARGPLVHEWRWKQTLQMAEWFAHRNGLGGGKNRARRNAFDVCPFDENISKMILRNRR